MGDLQPRDAKRLVAVQANVVPDTPGTWLQLAIVATGVVGDCGLHFLDERQVEFSITLDPAHQRRGYAAERPWASCWTTCSARLASTG